MRSSCPTATNLCVQRSSLHSHSFHGLVSHTRTCIVGRIPDPSPPTLYTSNGASALRPGHLAGQTCGGGNGRGCADAVAGSGPTRLGALAAQEDHRDYHNHGQHRQTDDQTHTAHRHLPAFGRVPGAPAPLEVSAIGLGDRGGGAAVPRTQTSARTGVPPHSCGGGTCPRRRPHAGRTRRPPPPAPCATTRPAAVRRPATPPQSQGRRRAAAATPAALPLSPSWTWRVLMGAGVLCTALVRTDGPPRLPTMPGRTARLPRKRRAHGALRRAARTAVATGDAAFSAGMMGTAQTGHPYPAGAVCSGSAVAYVARHAS
jgi:hypothetical protein